MEKICIKNRKGLKICVVVEQNPKQIGLVFLIHGLSGAKEQPQIRVVAETFFDKDFTVVTFDTSNTFGESEGQFEDSTVTTHYEDLEDVITWAKKQVWYQEPFVLEGHSLGGISVLLYAEKYPKEILALAPISTLVSGKLRLEAYEKYSKEMLEEWKKTGWRITESKTFPGVIKKLPWSHMEDNFKYDTIPEAHKLTMPVLLVVSEIDKSTPLEAINVLYQALPAEKELHVIKNDEHTFRGAIQLQELRNIFSAWIDKII